MANNLSANPLKVDTAMTASLRNYLGPAYVPTGRFCIHHVDWVGPVNNGDTFNITDGNSDTIAAGKVSTSNLGQTFTEVLGMSIMDLQVTQISSGTLYIHLKSKLE